MVTALLVAYGGVAIATVFQRPPRSPVTLTLLRWQQFTDSCVGIFVARSAVTHPIALELTVTNRKGSTEITPEERVGQVEVGHTVHFTVYETPCREIGSWRVREQSHDLRDDPVHTTLSHEE